LRGRALVTGAGRGIGAAVAVELARAGHPVILNYRENTAAAEATLVEVQRAGGVGTLWRCDVRDRAAVTAGIDELLAADENPIAVLVNNAGIVRDAPFPVLSETDWQDVTRTTLDGFFNVTQPLVMAMVRRRHGRIVNMASVSALIGNRGQVNYSAAKAGLVAATRVPGQSSWPQTPCRQKSDPKSALRSLVCYSFGVQPPYKKSPLGKTKLYLCSIMMQAV
jgi:3-oxoacyl-[acyl-carrier protein] reductase